MPVASRLNATIAVLVALMCPLILPVAQADDAPQGRAPIASDAAPRAGDSSGRGEEAGARVLQPLLAGEFALQAGRLDEAARWYLQAALAAGDVALAEKTTHIALLAKDDARAARAVALWRELGGEGLALRAAQATLALRANDPDGALEHLAVLLRAPDDQGWRLALGVVAAGARDPEQATAVLKALVEAGRIPDQLQAWLAFGGLAQNLQRPELASQIVAEVIERFPAEPRVALLHASQLREAGKDAQARAVLETLLQQTDHDVDLRLQIAAQYDALGDLEAAAATLARGPQDDQTYALRASILARGDDSAALIELYEELRRDAARPDPQRRLLLGQIAEFLERFDEALQWYRGVPGSSLRWPAKLRSANALSELGRPDEAYRLLRELQTEAAAPDDTRRNAYLLEAALRHTNGDDPGELDAFARGLAAFPDAPEILYARALSWERRDNIARAEADLRKILVAHPDNVAALNALGYTLADRTTRYQEALELINRARAAQPDNAAIIDSHGWVLYRLGRTQEALGELRRAYALQKDAEIAAHLGEVLWVLGKHDQARKYFDQARELDPDNRSLQRALEKTGA